MTSIIGDKLDAEWDAARAELARMVRHPGPAPSFTPSASSVSSQPEVPVSPLLADADKAARALTSHIAVLLGNPLVDAIVEAGLGLVLTPGEVTAVVAFVQAVEADRAAPGGSVQPVVPADGSGTQDATPAVM